MKTKLLIACSFAFMICGCSISNWNIGNSEITQFKPQSQPTSYQPDKPQNNNFNTNNNYSKPVVSSSEIPDIEEINEPIEDNAKTTTNAINEPLENNQTNTTKEPIKNSAGLYHISTIISAWGEPTSKKADGSYIWQNCKATGSYEEICNNNTCHTVPKTNCCDRVLTTNEGGYVTNLKEAIQACQ